MAENEAFSWAGIFYMTIVFALLLAITCLLFSLGAHLKCVCDEDRVKANKITNWFLGISISIIALLIGYAIYDKNSESTSGHRVYQALLICILIVVFCLGVILKVKLNKELYEDAQTWALSIAITMTVLITFYFLLHMRELNEKIKELANETLSTFSTSSEPLSNR